MEETWISQLWEKLFNCLILLSPVYWNGGVWVWVWVWAGGWVVVVRNCLGCLSYFNFCPFVSRGLNKLTSNLSWHLHALVDLHALINLRSTEYIVFSSLCLFKIKSVDIYKCRDSWAICITDASLIHSVLHHKIQRFLQTLCTMQNIW